MSTAVFGAPEWQASSGRTLKPLEDGTITFQGSHGYLAPRTAMDAEEYFQAKKDADLGRWRWPENPDYVVYRTDVEGGFMVLDERAGKTYTYTWSAIKNDASFDGPWNAARAYFEAHPERKPWEDASAGDIWVLTFESGGTSAWVRIEGGWVLPGEDLRAKLHLAFTITAGHRIWPVDEMAPGELHVASSQAGLASIRSGL